MIPTLLQNDFPSVGSAPIDVGKGGQERSLSPRTPVSPRSAHSGTGQTTSPTITSTPTVLPKRKFTGTIPVMDHFGTGPTISPSVNHLPSRAPITDAPISSYPSASPSIKNTPEPTVSPSIPLQSFSQSEKPRLISAKPSKGSVNTPTTFSLSLTAKPLSGIMYSPSTTPTLYPSSLKEANQSELLSLQTFEQNSNKAGLKTTDLEPLPVITGIEGGPTYLVTPSDSSNSTSKPSELPIRPALLSSLAVVAVSFFALIVALALKFNERFRNQKKTFASEEASGHCYNFHTPCMTEDCCFSTSPYPQHQAISCAEAGCVNIPDGLMQTVSLSPNEVFDIFDCRQVLEQLSSREEKVCNPIHDGVVDSFFIEQTLESCGAETVVSNLTAASIPTINKVRDNDECSIAVSEFDPNISILSFYNDSSNFNACDDEQSSKRDHSGHLDLIKEESSSCMEHSLASSDQLTGCDLLDNTVSKMLGKKQQNYDEESLDSYSDLCSKITDAMIKEGHLVKLERDEDVMLLDLDSYSDCGISHQQRALSEQLLRNKDESSDSESSMGSYDLLWANEMKANQLCGTKNGSKNNGQSAHQKKLSSKTQSSLRIQNKLAEKSESGNGGRAAMNDAITITSTSTTEIVLDKSCLESQAETVDVDFEDEHGFGSNYC
jgi:hypothetical protein